MNEIIKMLAATYAVIGQEASDIQIQTVANDLADYEVDAIAIALTKCRKELRGKMALADILQRIPGEHPGPEEAWGIMSKTLNNESVSVSATQPMLTAYGACAGMDEVSGRMTFKEVYQREVSDARARNQRPYWIPSLGFEPQGRTQAQDEAEQKNILSEKALPLLTSNHRQLPGNR